jgi:hypothetical protein
LRIVRAEANAPLKRVRKGTAVCEYAGTRYATLYDAADEAVTLFSISRGYKNLVPLHGHVHGVGKLFRYKAIGFARVRSICQ